ncbi:MAG: hypothetical protein CMF74_09925 [Maricaulis sp.]|jgi:hypothetical protein|nr:hypothetical protein [Maricaulis sp.]HAQ34722.1 hypothetical protein [Alphaproteobacteria bacterium]|tara:strand:+ start:454 stop:867 length:414 start_codon:yes stop_codon:yes gene_type:complete
MTQPLRKPFSNAGAAQPRKYPPPFSLRLSEHERAILRHRAGRRSLGEYIRHVLFGERASPRKVTRCQPSESDRDAAAQLAGLGQSRLASNINQIAKAANMGALPVTPDLLEELHQACADIRAMRDALIASQGLKVRG